MSLLIMGLAGLLVLPGIARGALGAESLNATESFGLPAWLDDLAIESGVSYPAHMALGTIFETLKLSPAATAVQWLKAAGHVPSEAELSRAARGISTALERDTDDRRAFRTICRLKDIGNRDQIAAVERSGAPCDRWVPNIALQATATPAGARAGETVSLSVSATSVSDIVALVDVEIHDQDDTKVAQWVFSDQALNAGKPRAYAVTWEIPSSLPPGDYEVKIGVFEPGWTALHGWKTGAAMVTVSPQP
ncbi:MAG: hypothetical protein AB7P40_03115 [Chloroflexota bacterium]